MPIEREGNEITNGTRFYGCFGIPKLQNLFTRYTQISEIFLRNTSVLFNSFPGSFENAQNGKWLGACPFQLASRSVSSLAKDNGQPLSQGFFPPRVEKPWERDLKRGQKKVISFHYYDIAITASHSARYVCINIPELTLVWTLRMFGEKIENSWSGARAFSVTSNLANSGRFHDENGKEMYQTIKRTCRACKAIVFVH